MRFKRLLAAVLCLAVTSIVFAQSRTAASTPDEVIRKLYEAQKSGKDAPFFQYKSRPLVDRYFTSDLGDLIWKDAVAAKGEVGALDFDPVYYSQDPQITDFIIGKPRDGGSPDSAFVPVTFKNAGKAEKVEFELLRGADKTWKIHSIIYSDGEDLGSILRYALDPKVRAEYDANPFKGDYLVGTKKCTVTPTKTGLAYKVQCDGEENVRLFMVEGTETQTEYIHTDDKGVERGKFVFKNGETSGKFIDESGKEVKVSRAQTASPPAGEPEAQNIRGELQVGKTESVLLYVGEESGDYAAYCFTNDSEAGRAIFAACKNGEQCEFKGTVDSESGCKVPGLEATLSASGKILKVESAKSLGRKK